QLILDQAITPFKGRINVYLTASSKDGSKYLSAPQTCTCPAGRFRPHQGSCYQQLAAEVLHRTFGGRMDEVYRLMVTYENGDWDMFDVALQAKDEATNVDEVLRESVQTMLTDLPVTSVSAYKLVFTEMRV